MNNLVPKLEKIKVNSMRFSRGRIPPVSPIIHEELSRDGVISLLTHTGVYGIELGVAGGHFSARMVQSNIFKHFLVLTYMKIITMSQSTNPHSN